MDKSRISIIKSDPEMNTGKLPPVTEGEELQTITTTTTSHESRSIFLQTANHLLDVHAFKFTEMCLAHELMSLEAAHCSSYDFLVAEARLHMQRQNYEEAISSIKLAIEVDTQVCAGCP